MGFPESLDGPTLPFSLMITIACTNCKTELTMDEAFAGGVCRCQHCGTIQTVPSHLKKGSTAGATTGHAVGTSKSLYQQTRASTDAASGLESLGEAVTSSGLGSARLKAPPRVPPSGSSIDNTAAAPAKNPLFLPLIIAVVVLAVVVIGLLIYVVTRSSGSATNAGGTAENGGTPGSVVVPAGPSFLGASIKGTNIVYLIDRGNAMNPDPSTNYFDGIKAALFKSLHSLGPDRSFKVVLWDNGDTPVSVPTHGIPIDASDANIQEVQTALRDVVASGASTVDKQLSDAVRLKPDAIVIATAKVQLSDDDIAALKKAAKAGIQLYFFDIGNNMLSDAFHTAVGSDGSYYSISEGQLAQFAQ